MQEELDRLRISVSLINPGSSSEGNEAPRVRLSLEPSARRVSLESTAAVETKSPSSSSSVGAGRPPLPPYPRTSLITSKPTNDENQTPSGCSHLLSYTFYFKTFANLVHFYQILESNVSRSSTNRDAFSRVAKLQNRLSQLTGPNGGSSEALTGDASSSGGSNNL